MSESTEGFGSAAVPGVAGPETPVSPGLGAPRPTLSRGAWFAYAGAAFVVVLGGVVGAGLLLRGGGAADPDETVGTGSEPGRESGPDVRPTYAPTPAPTWNETPLAGVTLAARTAQYPGEPASYVMEDRIWDYVGAGWTLAIYRYQVDLEPRDAAAFQGIYLISPENHVFFLHKLRTDYYLSVVAWDPAERKAWISRQAISKDRATVELDLVPGDAIEAWVVDDGAAWTINNVYMVGPMSGGTMLFGVSNSGAVGWWPERIMTRPTGGPTTMLAPVVNTGTWDPNVQRVNMWVDADAGLLYYRYDVTDSWDWSARTSTWFTHDLATDTVTPMATPPQEPGPEAGGCMEWDPVMVDGWLVENCFLNEAFHTWLIDPTGERPAIEYGGAVPQRFLAESWVDLDPAIFGPSVPPEDYESVEQGIAVDPAIFGNGWTPGIRALPRP